MKTTHTLTLSKTVSFAALLALSLLFTGCQEEEAAGAVQAQAAPMPVTVMTVQQQAVALARELPGRTSPYRMAEVRARVNGIVEKRLFEEGTDVESGQVLFQIDPAPYQATYDAAKAALARAEASYASAKSQAERYQELVATNAISKQNYDDAVASEQSLKAQIAAAKADLKAAEINLGYTEVTAPISGRIGRAGVTEGAYVQQAAATLLGTIQQLDPLYIDLNESAEEVLRLKEALASGKLSRSSDGNAKVEVVLADGSLYPHAGSLQFSDVTVNPGTGTVTLRAIVPNPEAKLLPGMFVRARLEEGTDPNAILVPHSLVSRNARGEAVTLVVGSEGTVESRILESQRSVGSAWLVTGGLEPGDRIITNNLQKIRAGMQVQVQ
ncbi:efflux RND transporter periplasmic adaptor subunit [Coraliomargarita parva]|uniref:efflux RND transporter periplasmic adaptor subunit n=1 Tax=Coraliomargarita parva TaxID=3014050 RepID=UPI0022B48322|nr:efflux RND transporter periplasmic adaptor subunit [Coraliomargarita parva]